MWLWVFRVTLKIGCLTPQNFDLDNYYFPVVDEDVPPVHHNEVKPMDMRKTYNTET